MVLGHWRRAMGAASVGVALFALTLAPASAATTTVSQEVIGGNLTVEVSEPGFSAVNYSNTASTNSDAPVTISVEDLTGTNAGWNVSLQQTTDLDAGDGKVILRSNVSVNTIADPAVVNGQPIGETGGPMKEAGTGALNVDRTVMNADAGYGKGSYTQAVGLRINVPAMTLAGTYEGTLTATIAVGP